MDYQELFTAISDMLEEKLDKKLEEKLDAKLEKNLAPIRADIIILKDQALSLNDKMDTVQEDILGIKEEIADIRTDISGMQAEMADMRTDISEVRRKVERNTILIENQLIPDIRLLSENYVPAAKRYVEAEKERVEMGADIKLLKIVVAEHSVKLCELMR